MTTEQIQAFLELADSLSYTNTATKLQIATSTLSRQISAMERELQMDLFYRNQKKVALTVGGQYMFTELKKLYEEYKQILHNGQQIQQGVGSALAIGVLDEVTLNGVAQDNLQRFQSEHPDCELSLGRGSFRSLNTGLRDGTFDLAITFLFGIEDDVALKYKILEPIVDGVLISSHNPLAKLEYFNPQEFADQTFIVIADDENSRIRRGPVEFCKRYGFYPKMRFAPDVDTAALWVEAGLGIAFTYSKSVGSYNPAMTFIPLKGKEKLSTASKLVLAWHEQNLNPAKELFLKEFRK